MVGTPPDAFASASFAHPTALTFVVPANAGTHNHRWSLLDDLLPLAADTFRITTTECMGPGVRRDDGGVFVGTVRKFSDSHFKQPCVYVLAPPREVSFWFASPW
jgi:hypothetical protein